LTKRLLCDEVALDQKPTTAHRKEPLHEERPNPATRQGERCGPPSAGHSAGSVECGQQGGAHPSPHPAGPEGRRRGPERRGHRALAGEWYRRSGGHPGAVRWCRQRGSVALLDQKLPVTYQRVRDRLQTTEIPLPTYQQLQPPRAADTGRFRTVLEGLSCRRDAACAEAVPAWPSA
jgi:hypothetical protein